jgi:beta-glucosidase
VLPKGSGAINEPGLAFYDRLIEALLAAEIEPWLCLYHWGSSVESVGNVWLR